MAGIYAMVCTGVIILRRRAGVQVSSAAAHVVVLPYLALGACVPIEIFALLEPLRPWRQGRFPAEWLMLLAWGSWGIWLARKA
jgi:hypothetical protein